MLCWPEIIMAEASFNHQFRHRVTPESTKTYNRCAIIPGTTTISAQALERKGQSWSVHTNTASDLTIIVEGDSFHLHKLPLASRSMHLNRLIFQRPSKDTNHSIQIDLPGGIEAFKSVIEFCYGLPVHLTASNIAPIYCAAHFLEMTDDMEEGNLISKAEAFLSFAIFSSWHDTIAIYRSCETLSSWPHKLRITRRCCESIAWKVCIDAHTIRGSLINNDDGTNNSSRLNTTKIESWWIEGVSILRIDHFVEVISAIKAKGMNLKLVSACIMHWAEKSLLEIEMRIQETKNKDLVHSSAIECLIRVLPMGFVSFNFLLRLLKLGLILNISEELVKEIEKEVVEMLESCSAGDLVVQNYGVEYDRSISCDVNLVRRVVETYITFASFNAELQKMAVVAGIVDAYLTMVAREDNLSVETFLSVAEAFPKCARVSDDSLYMAVDTYLKAHPSLTEEERKRVCSPMEFQRLSLEARMHVLQNERLPLDVTIRYLLVEQVVLARSLSLGERLLEAHEELGIMKEQVMEMKAQLSDLQIGHAELNEIARQKGNHNSRRKTT